MTRPALTSDSLSTASKPDGRGWAKLGIFLGGGVSVAANVAHSFIPPAGAPTNWHPQLGAVLLSMVWPVFLFIGIEILVKSAWPHLWYWQALRWLGLLPVVLVSGLVSYRHLHGLLLYYGDEPLVAALGPLSVDGVMAMATGALIAINTTTRHAATPAQQPTTSPATSDAPATPPTTSPAEPQPTPALTVASATPPTHLLPAARFALANHEQTTGRPITTGELATRMSITPEVAASLLAAIDHTHPTPTNGATITGAAR